MTDHVLIIGAGQTAAVAARTLRRRGFEGRITLIGEETHPPYQRPPLSKEYLQGEQSRESLSLLTQGWCADKEVELCLGSPAIRLDPSEQTVELGDGSRLHGDTVLFATGTRPRALSGVQSERVHYLRSLEDSDAIRAVIAPRTRIVVVGAGFVGSEVASSSRALGADVTLLEQMDVPLENVLGSDLGAVCADIHRNRGVDLRTGEGVASITDSSAGALVHTTRGDTIEGDAVIIGAGVLPNAEVAERSGITVDNGIVVDEYCRTSQEGVFAAGDVANHFHPLFGRHMRVEHFDNANKQGAAAAKNLLGRKTVFDDPHWFWSDQHGLNLQHAGDTQRRTDLVVRGSVEARDFLAFGVDEDCVVRSVFAVERGGDVPIVQELIAAAAPVDPARLRDESTDLAELLPDT